MPAHCEFAVIERAPAMLPLHIPQETCDKSRALAMMRLQQKMPAIEDVDSSASRSRFGPRDLDHADRVRSHSRNVANRTSGLLAPMAYAIIGGLAVATLLTLRCCPAPSPCSFASTAGAESR
jgi:hypothetical protein